MNNTVRLIAAAAAVVVVALIGYQLLLAPNVGGPAPLPSPSEAPPTPAASPDLSASLCDSPEAVEGALAVGEPYRVPAGGYEFHFAVPTDGWIASWNDECTIGYLTRRTGGEVAARIVTWNPDRVYVDPCNQESASLIGPSASDLVTAMASIPGTEAIHQAVRLGGHSGGSPPGPAGYRADYVEITVSNEIDCGPGQFHLWSAGEEDPRVLSAVPSTIRGWVVSLAVNRHLVNISGGMQRFLIESEILNGNLEINREIDQIIDSMSFPG